VIAAPTQAISQDWFRTVRGKVADGVLEQVSPEFIVFDRTKLNLGRSTSPNAEAPHFMNKMIFNLMNDNEGRNITTFVNGSYSEGESILLRTLNSAWFLSFQLLISPSS
jgi:hypothetical protein